MNTSPNRRPPCGGWGQPLSLGPCDQHHIGAEELTRVRNITQTSRGNPYALQNNAGLPPCADEPITPYGPWTRATAAVSCSATPVGSWCEEYANCYEVTSSVTPLPACASVGGYKNLQVKRVWHGRFDFCSHDASGRDGCPDLEQPSCCDTWEDEKPSAETTKYLTSSIWIHHSANPGGDEKEYEFTEISSVNPNSGVVTVVNSEHGPKEFQPYWYDLFSVTASCGRPQPPEGLAWAFADDYEPINDPPDQVETIEQEFSCDYIRYFYRLDFREWVDDHYEPRWNEYEVIIELSDPHTSKAVWDDAVWLLSFWSEELANDLLYPWRTDGYCTVAPQITRREVQAPVSPGGVHEIDWVDPAADEYNGEIIGLPLSHWYPGAKMFDGFFDFDHRTWKRCDDGSGLYPWYVYSYGAMSGSNSYGASDPTDAAVPKIATKWTENYEASQYPPNGPFAIFRDGMLVLQVYAQTLLPTKSLNFARPCGKDRFAPDWDVSYCVTNYDTHAYFTAGLSGIATNDLVMVCGTGGDDGIWRVTIDSNNITLSERVIPPDEIPEEFLGSCASCQGDAMITRLRWQDDAPAICGRLYVQGWTEDDTDGVSVELDRDHYLVTGDTVQVRIMDGVEQTAETTVTFVDRTHVRLDDFTEAKYPAGYFLYLRQSSSPDWQWDDEGRKHDFVITEYHWNYREVGENQRLITLATGACSACKTAPDEIRPYQESSYGVPQEISSIVCTTHCLRPRPCHPSIVWWNYHDLGLFSAAFAEGHRGTMASIVLDERYGARWQAVLANWMQDPYWQRPLVYCDTGYRSTDTWEEDSGDGWGQYPMRPYVEARCEVPEGAPALPINILIGCASTSELNSSVSGKNVCAPIEEIGSVQQTGEPLACVYPWAIAAAMQQCVCSELCEWRPVYESYGHVCQEVTPP